MNGSDGSPNGDVIYRRIDPDASNPEVDVVRVVADLEGTDPTGVPDLYSAVDSLLERLFSDPPADGARARVEFTYAGYRIGVDQDGRASFREVE